MNYYEVLRVPSTASVNEIKNAYKKLVKRYHPDVYEGNKLFAETKIKEINEAYEILSEKSKKAEYDAELNYQKYEPTREDFVKTYSREDVNRYKDIYQKSKVKENVEEKPKIKLKSRYNLNEIGKKYFFKFDSAFPTSEKEDMLIILLLSIIVLVSISIANILT